MTEPKRPAVGTAYYAHIDTRYGPMLIAGEGRHVVAIKFGVPRQRIISAIETLERELRGRYRFEPDEAKTRTIRAQVIDFLEGKRAKFDLDLDLSWMTPFQRDVLLEAARVPRGQIVSYAEIARRVGRPNAYRAVGNTMRINPVPLVVPCHRIVGTDRGLTGFGGGLPMKRELLEMEGVVSVR